MATSNMIKKWIRDRQNTVAKLEKEIGAAKTKTKKLEGDLKKAVAREKAAPKKRVVKKAKPKKKAPAKKKARPKKKKR
jgi:histone H1/5